MHHWSQSTIINHEHKQVQILCQETCFALCKQTTVLPLVDLKVNEFLLRLFRVLIIFQNLLRLSKAFRIF